MKHKPFFLTASLVTISVFATYFVTLTTTAQQPQPVIADNEYQVAAILFQQHAAEYRALTYQAFNVAKMTIEADFDKKNLKTLPKEERKKPRALVVDVDETVLDNSPHQADLVKKRLPFTNSIWTEWCNLRKAKPIPGAVEFLQYANSKGVRVFYVTNRNETEKIATIDNLKSAGFPDVSEETVLVRTTESTKEPRRQLILQKHRIVLLAGDNLNDLSNVFERKSIADRFMEVDKTKDLYGHKFIVLPNVMYGEWEGAIYEFKRLTEAEKTAKRLSSLQTF
jgi:5'-nucleotidase (lipoprotein e(P4) family)